MLTHKPALLSTPATRSPLTGPGRRRCYHCSSCEWTDFFFKCTNNRAISSRASKLTALHELRLDVADYAHGSRAFTALSRSLPCLQQLQVLDLGAYEVVALQAGDVLAIGSALKAWPLPLLHDVKGLLRLSTCWRALGLPGAAADEDWTNATTLDYFRVQQQKVAAFASGMHWRLGAASGVSWLDEQALVMIADEVLGGWGLLKEWRQELVAAKV